MVSEVVMLALDQRRERNKQLFRICFKSSFLILSVEYQVRFQPKPPALSCHRPHCLVHGSFKKEKKKTGGGFKKSQYVHTYMLKSLNISWWPSKRLIFVLLLI